MLVFEFKVYGKSVQFSAIDDAIRTAQFVRNSCIRLWMDVKDIGKNDLQKYCAVLAANFPFANELNSMAQQASAVSEACRRHTSMVFYLSVLR